MHRITRGKIVAIAASLALFVSGLMAAPALALPAVQAPQPVENDLGGVSFIPGSVVVVMGNQGVLSCTIQPQPSDPSRPCIGMIGMGDAG
jgi:hypothetical protein